MSDYQQLAARFGEVRSSWKRAAALSGLAVVVTEGIGILTILLFLDWLYYPSPVVRISMWVAALAGIAWLVLRHVAAPLSRKIPDEQIAMYIEEHRDDLDGMLITAAEYGQHRERVASGQSALIEMVVNEASNRAGTAISHVVDFGRLKKYCMAGGAGIVIYILLSILFPNAIRHHIGRILNPWRPTTEDMPKKAPGAVLLGPVRFTLSKGDASLARGTSFDFEATLSRAADKPVILNFRPRVQGNGSAWQQLPMSEIEKLNGYQGTLADVSEDLEFYVSCGADKSDTHRLTIFDPLVIQSLEATTHYPDYVKLPDRVENPSSGDVEALIGSTVTVSIHSSTPLKEGNIKWGNGQTQPLTVDPQSSTTGAFSFEVKEDATYGYALTDTNGQQAASAGSLSVKAIPDQPPTITIKSPQSPVLTKPLGEVNLEIAAGDDFGVEGVDLVYSRLDDKDKPQETRIPLTMVPGDTKEMPNAVQSVYKLMLEKAVPPFKSDDAITYHLEARDAKGQKAISDLGFIVIGYYEAWGTYQATSGQHSGEHKAGPDLMAMLSLVWTLHGQKANIAPSDFLTQSKGIASKMVDERGNMLSFVDLEHMPQLAKVADKIALHAKNARDALVVADTTRATMELGIAATLFNGYAVMENGSIHTSAGGGAAGAHSAPPMMTMLEQARLEALNRTAADKQGQQQQTEESKAASAAGKKIEDLLKKEDEIISNVKGMAGAAGSKPHSDLAKDQKDLADKTKAAARNAKTGANAKTEASGKTGVGTAGKLDQAGNKANEAAKTMEEAAKAFAAGKNTEGAAKAEEAKKALQEAREKLQDTSRDKLEAAISVAAARAAVMLDKQHGLQTNAETISKEFVGGKAPDQRQYRDLQKLAIQQTELRANAESLDTDIDNLNSWAAIVGQPEAIRSLGEVQKTIKRGQPEVKMAGAVIDLNNASPDAAIEEQKKAAATLEKIIDDLHTGSDSLAASKDAQLRRAQRDAEAAKKGLEELAKASGEKPAAESKSVAQSKEGEQAKADGKAGEQTKPGEQPGHQAKPGENPGAQAKADGKAGAQPKLGEQPGQQAKSGENPGAQAKADGKGGAQPKPGEQPGQQPKPGENPDAKGKADGKTGGQPESGGGRQQMLQKLSYDLQRLATNLDNRDLVSQKDVDLLKEMTMDKAELDKRLAVDPKLLSDASDVVARISDKLEAETQAKIDASKLFSSQREECPPAYRQFVNQYFELLSQLVRPPEQAKKP